MSTPQRRALRTLSTANHSSPLTPPSSTSTPTKILHPRPPSATSPSQPSPASNKENDSPSPCPSQSPPIASPSPSRRRRQLMRLADLMASVAMTPIKEREEEDGLSHALVEVALHSVDDDLRRTEQEAEILAYQRMLQEDAEGEEEREVAPEADCGTDASTDSDGFHSADESDFQWAMAAATDERRSSHALLLVPQPSSQPSPNASDEAELTSPLTKSPPPDADDPFTAGRLLPPSDDSPARAELEDAVYVASNERSEASGVSTPVALKRDPQGRAGIVDPSSPPPSSSPYTLECAEYSLPSLTSPLPPAHPPTPTPCSTCPSCASLFLSLQHYQSECEALQGRVDEVTEEGTRLYAEYERKSVRMQELLLCAEQRDAEEAQRRAKDEDDYRSLYFAYVALERQHNALRDSTAALHPPPCEEVDPEQPVDYAVMVEEKRIPAAASPVPAQEPATSPPHSPESTEELERLRSDNARLLSELEARCAEVATSTATCASYRAKYHGLLAIHSSQASTFSTLSSLLTSMEELDALQAAAGTSFTHQSTLLRLTVAQRDAELRDARDDADALRAERDALSAALSDARDTVEYAQAEKTANEEELAELKRTLVALHSQQTAAAAEHSALVAVHRAAEQELSMAMTEQTASRASGRNARIALRAAQGTLQEEWECGQQRRVQLAEAASSVDRLEREAAAREAAHAHAALTAAEQIASLERSVQAGEERRAITEARLQSSEQQVQSITRAMATLDSTRKRPVADAPLGPSSELLHLQQKHAALAEQHRAVLAQLSTTEAELSSASQAAARARSSLFDERDARERAEAGRRQAEAEALRVRESLSELEGRCEAVEGRGRERARERSEVERRLASKDAVIARLSRTLKEMNLHITGEGAAQVRRLKAYIAQYQQVLLHVATILRQDEYSQREEVRQLLSLLDKSSSQPQQQQQQQQQEGAKPRKDGGRDSDGGDTDGGASSPLAHSPICDQ